MRIIFLVFVASSTWIATSTSPVCLAGNECTMGEAKSTSLLQRGSPRKQSESFSMQEQSLTEVENHQLARDTVRTTIQALLGKKNEAFEDGTTFAARGITLTIESAESSFRHGAPFPVTVTVKNGGDRNYVMMKWESPFEEEIVGNFFVSSLPSEYLGRIMERWTAPLTAENSALLAAGGTISVSFDLGRYLRFLSTGESSVSLDYDFMFFELESAASSVEDALQQLGPETNLDEEHATQAEFTSNSITVNVEDAGTSQAQNHATRAKTSGLSFTDCTADMQAAVTDATALATEMVASSQQYIASQQEGDDWTEWFGSADPMWAASVTTGINNIETVLHDESWIANCGCNENGVYAYVYPSDADRNVYLCSPVFWGAPAGKQRDSQPGTIIHELAHFTVIMGTSDHAYGTSALHSLALTNPAHARQNSDSVEAYTEDTDLPLISGNHTPPTSPPTSPSTSPPTSQNGTQSEAVTVSAGTYPGEVSWTLNCSDAQVGSGGAPYEGSVDVAPGATCELTLTDSYGDGWNGAVFSGLGQELTLESGTTSTETFQAPGTPSTPTTPPTTPPTHPPTSPPTLPPTSPPTSPTSGPPDSSPIVTFTAHGHEYEISEVNTN